MPNPMNVIDTRLPDLLRGPRPLLGMFVGIPAPSLVEMCGHAGVDFVIDDSVADKKLHSCRIMPERWSWIEVSVT